MQIPFFSELPIEPMKVLSYLCKREVFKPGETIFRQHEQDPNAYFIIAGRAVLVRENDCEEILREYAEDTFIGTLSLFSNVKRLFSLKAQSQVTCLILTREKFQKTLQQFPEIAAKMFESTVKSIYEWEAKLLGEHALSCLPCRSNLGVSLL